MTLKTLKRIDDILVRVNSHPEYSDQARTEFSKILIGEAVGHSGDLELVGEKNSKKQRKRRVQLSSRLDEAWKYLEKYGLDKTSLAALGKIVEPENNRHQNFRLSEVQFGEFVPPTHDRIPYLIDNLVESLDYLSVHPVLKSIELHVGLVGIHPYEDGNGRAARLVQNFYLHQARYPPVIIPSTDREMYIELLRGTIKDRYAEESDIFDPSRSEELFHYFIASKILASAERLEERLKERRRYEIVLNNVSDPSTANHLANHLKGLNRRQNSKQISVKIAGNKGRKQRLEVTGNIGRDELDKSVTNCSRRYGFDYTLN